MFYLNWFAIFWISSVSITFIGCYSLALWDKTDSRPSRARMTFTLIIGTLIVIATYADTLYHKAFLFKDLLLLAMVGVHGWKADDMVEGFINAVGTNSQKKPEAAPNDGNS